MMAEEEALASFCISLPSGQSTTISLPASSTVAALKEAAQEAFQQGWLRLATADGRLLLDPHQQRWMKSCCCPFSLQKKQTHSCCFLFVVDVLHGQHSLAMHCDLCVGTRGAYVGLAVMFFFLSQCFYKA